MKTKSILIWTTVVFAFTGTMIYLYNQLNLISDYCYKITTFKLKKFSKDGISINLSLLLKNQSNISVIVKSLNIDLFINDMKITNVNIDKSILWNKNSISPIEINIDVSSSDIKKLDLINLANIFSYYILGQKDKIFIRMKGNIKASIGNMPLPSFPIDINYSLEEMLKTSPSTCKI